MLLRHTLTRFAVCTAAAAGLSCGDGESDLGGPGRVATLAVTPGSARLEPGQTLQLHLEAYDLEGAALQGESSTWRTSDDGVATVSSSGLVTAVDVGAAGITALVEERSVTARITVGATIASVEITPESPALSVGRSVQLMATARGPGGTVLPSQIFEWRSSDTRVAPVNVGKVRGIRPGVATIVATTEGKSDTTTVTVYPPGELPTDPRLLGR
jgi:trimeric autotransporter adhesin